MEPPVLRSAVAAAISTISDLGLTANDAVVMHNSNRLALRVLPCDIVARVAGPAHARAASLEVEIVRKLAEIDAPVAQVAPRVGHRVYERDGFWVTLWTYYDPATPPPQPDAYAGALKLLHAGLRTLNVATPVFTDRVAEAQQLVASHDDTPALDDGDRELLRDTLGNVTLSIARRGATEQLLHGEPHAGNVLNATSGLLFIDFETLCRGPIEFDLAHVPDTVSERYPGADHELLGECLGLVIAIVAAWRFDKTDQLPNGQRAGHQLMDALRKGAPYPSLDAMKGDS